MTSFDYLWQVIDPADSYPQVKDTCRKIWDAQPLQRQRIIYATIKQKLRDGEKVHPNPKFALEDNLNAQPEFLNGIQQDECWMNGIPIVQVRYNGVYKICTLTTMKRFGLEFVKEWRARL